MSTAAAVSSEDKLEHTIGIVVVVLKIVGYVFLYVGMILSYGFSIFHAITSVTTDSLAQAAHHHPFLFAITVVSATASCLIASYLCLRGALRAIVPLVILTTASILMIGVGFGLLRLWDRASR